MLFGYVPLSVQTDSMSPTLEVGDLIIGKQSGKDDNYQVGDIITYWAVQENEETGEKTSFVNTHRIVEVTTMPLDKSKTAFITKGDHNLVEDKNIVNIDNVIATYEHNGKNDGIRVSKLGSVLTFLRKPSGFFICVVLPMAVFFIYELVRFITNLIAYNKSKSREAALEAAKEIMGNDSSSDSSGLSEEQKAQAILDYIEKQKQAGVDETDNSATTQEEVTDS